MKVCVLGSGSSGNCTYISGGSTSMLLDAGLSGREIEKRLAGIGVSCDSIRAVCVSHEHVDHVSGLGVLQRRHGMALYANSGTIEALERTGKVTGLSWTVFETGKTFDVGEMRVEAFPVPHDSYDPVGFLVREGDVRVAVVTDMGMATTLIRERLKNCHAMIVEANHDEQMLKDASRPWPLKQRIAGNQGHLSNTQASALLLEVTGPSLRDVFLAHLSQDCNKPEVAVRQIRKALDGAGHAAVALRLTYPDRPSDVVEIRLS